MNPVEQRITIPAGVEHLAELRQFVRDVARSARAAPSTVDDVVLAVDEAATNIIVHGYAGSPGTVEASVAVVGDSLRITLEDRAPAFDPRSAPSPDMGVHPLARGPGGMGIRLMRLAMDGLDYAQRAEGGNRLIMTRSLAARPEEDR